MCLKWESFVVVGSVLVVREKSEILSFFACAVHQHQHHNIKSLGNLPHPAEYLTKRFDINTSRSTLIEERIMGAEFSSCNVHYSLCRGQQQNRIKAY